MTNSFNRSEIYSYYDLNSTQQQWVKDIYFDDIADAENDRYVVLDTNNSEPFPLSKFIKCDNNNFTHGIFSTSAFDGYFITLNRSNDECVIAHKYF